jgi:ribosomal-protein-alanine N-acetyltransferase
MEISMPVDEFFSHFPTLTTPRLLLRQIEMSDAEALFPTFSDLETMKLFGTLQTSIEETREMIQRWKRQYAQRQVIRWGVTLKGEDRVIGSCPFFNLDEGFHRAETGYILNRAYWKQGIMSEAMSAVLTFGFMQLGLQRIEALVDPENENSKGLLQRLGFIYEGRLRQHYFSDGLFSDDLIFSLLKDEWQAHI